MYEHGGVILEHRIKKIFNNTEEEIDIIIIKNSTEPFIDENFFYVTGLNKGLFEGSIVVLFPDGKLDIITSSLEAESAKKSNSNVLTYNNGEEFKEILEKYRSFDKIGINSDRLTYKAFNNLNKQFENSNFFDVSTSFSKARIIKDEKEINLIKKACNIVDKVVEEIPQIVHENITEYELAAEIDFLMQKNGAEKSAFETISSFGKNTAEPHYTHGDLKLEKGDFVLCDFGACFEKYNSDITRTFVFNKASAKQKEIFDIVSNASKVGLNKAKAGIKSKDIHNSVNSVIDNTKYKGRFIHSTGHSLGLSVHDGNYRISSNSELELKENMVFTIEPGIYLPGFGGVRIEDDVLIKEDGIELLTKSSKDFIVI